MTKRRLTFYPVVTQPWRPAGILGADRHYPPPIGIAASANQGVVGASDLALRPLLRPGEVVENIPGVIVTQHSGSGKANQYFMRGFNLDHGTDLAVSVDGVLVNMRTHTHGQGYADLSVFNLLDAEASDIDYFYTSRLPGEPLSGIDDIHTHPAEPRAFRVSLTVRL